MKKLIIYPIFLLFWGCSNLFYFPTNYFYADPKTQDIQYVDINFKSTDDTDLHGWMMTSDKVKEKKGLILFFHGNAQNLSAHWLNLGWLTKKGYDIFIFDYRGYGLSKGQANQQGVNKDSVAALNWAYEKQKKYPKFIIYSQSLGGTISMRALKDFDHRDEVDLYVLDSTFMSYQSIAFDKLKNAGIFVILSPLGYVLVSDEYAPREFVKKIEIPTLVIHGTKDPVVPYKFGEEIYNELETKKKWWWSVEDGGHTDVFWPKHLKYRTKFVNFLEEKI